MLKEQGDKDEKYNEHYDEDEDKDEDHDDDQDEKGEGLLSGIGPTRALLNQDI